MAVGAGAYIVAGIGAASAAYSAHEQSKSADNALQQQKEQAAQAEANRPQASKAPTTSAIMGQQAGTGQAGGAPGVAQTFLTGASGVDPSTLNIGKSTLLGG